MALFTKLSRVLFTGRNILPSTAKNSSRHLTSATPALIQTFEERYNGLAVTFQNKSQHT